MGIYSSQFVLVTGIPYHIKDLCLHHRSISSEDDISGILSKSNSRIMLFFRAESDDFFWFSRQIELEDNNNDDAAKN